MDKLTKEQKEAKKKHEYYVRYLEAHNLIFSLYAKAGDDFNVNEHLKQLLFDRITKVEFKELLADMAAKDAFTMKTIKALLKHS